MKITVYDRQNLEGAIENGGIERNGKDLDQKEQEQLKKIDFLMNQVEKPAAIAEVKIWRELVGDSGGRMGVHK